eukprot:gnl/Hemi2/22233_TR7399_c0_g2_i1.p1 gnl/Hemi2/22233_TR7399_c0_g2~~gnl/Hemi2/22233_TR7399_c0_g2_i1.p1  ORF type:complete len:251 (-),score=83.10 gnl/Hemi2/22233_TR7399_c0_g2_i1:243-995(-)
MRRRAGIQGLQGQTDRQKQFQSVGASIQGEQMRAMSEQVEAFKAKLTAFASRHKHQINRNPEFRAQFQDMCRAIGVDPLASNKGFWAELLGVGSFYYELSVQITEVCLRTRPHNGGLLDLAALADLLNRPRRSGAAAAALITEDDIERAIGKLTRLGAGFKVLSVGKRKVVQSVAVELNVDHTAVLLQASKDGGFVTCSRLGSALGWTQARMDSALDMLVREGMAWVDLQAEGRETQFWFPSLCSFLLES